MDDDDNDDLIDFDDSSSTLEPALPIAGPSKGKAKKSVHFRHRRGTPADGEDTDLDGDARMSDLGETTDEEEEEDNNDNDNPVRSRIPDPSSPSSPSLHIRVRKGDNESDKVQLANGAWLTNYEYNRLLNIARNKQELRKLGIIAAVDNLKESLPKASESAKMFVKRRTRLPGLPPQAPQRIPPTRLPKTQPKT